MHLAEEGLGDLLVLLRVVAVVEAKRELEAARRVGGGAAEAGEGARDAAEVVKQAGVRRLGVLLVLCDGGEVVCLGCGSVGREIGRGVGLRRPDHLPRVAQGEPSLVARRRIVARGGVGYVVTACASTAAACCGAPRLPGSTTSQATQQPAPTAQPAVGATVEADVVAEGSGGRGGEAAADGIGRRTRALMPSHISKSVCCRG